MAGRKHYAVKTGRKTGIFSTWEECRTSVEGYPGAEYKSFREREEAESYLGIAPGPESASPKEELKLRAGTASGERFWEALTEAPEEWPEPGTLLVYVDGSYDHLLQKYAFGCVFILPEGRICTEYGNGDKPQALQHRNVTGEMLGAMYAVRTAMVSGFSKVELRYDYEGIEKWVTGAWRSKTELTGKYAKAMREWGRDIGIVFTKVPAHSHVYYNELADKTAKTGLREGRGTPRVRSLYEEPGDTEAVSSASVTG